MKKIALLIAACTSLSAQTSVQFLPVVSGNIFNSQNVTLNTPATTAYTAPRKLRIEFRWHDIVWPSRASGGDFGYQFAWIDKGNYDAAITDNSYGGTTEYVCARPYWGIEQVCVDPGTTYTDVAFRYQVDIDEGWFSFDGFDVATGTRIAGFPISNKNGSSTKTFTVGAVPAQKISSFGFDTIGKLAYMKLFSTTVAIATVPHEWTTADLADYRFENNLTDTAGNTTLSLASGKTASYSSSLTYGPLCSAGTSSVFRAGFAQQLDGSGSASFYSASVPSLRWSLVSGPSKVEFSSLTTAQPTIRGLVTGTYTFQLTVTEGALSTTCSVSHSAVASDDNGTVSLASKPVSFLLGPLMRYGANPWTWADNRHKAMADRILSQLDTYYADTWNTAVAGTIEVTTGSTAVVGTNTTFTTTFCGGTASPSVANGKFIVVWYPVPGETNHYGRVPVAVASCQDDTHLTLTQAWGYWNSEALDSLTPAGSGYSYAVSDLSNWYGNGTPVNYYDVVAGLYALYYRTGNTTYLTGARKFADRWWQSPVWDEGRAYYSTIFFYAYAPVRRNAAVLGLVLRALDGRPEMWSGLRRKWTWDITWLNVYQSGNHSWDDIRENAYVLSDLSYCVAVDPDSSQQTLCRNAIANAFTNALAYQYANRANGGMESYWYSAGSWSTGSDGGVHGAQVTNGSTAVTGTGTNWSSQFCSSGTCSTKTIWFYPTPSTAMPLSTAGDTVVYTATYVSDTQLTLDRTYEGTTSTNSGWVLGDDAGRIGWGTQPFMAGMAAISFDYAGRALTMYGDTANAATAFSYAQGLAAWIRDYGYRASTKGLYYVGGLVMCPSTGGASEAAMCTAGYTTEQSRSLSPEAIRGMGMAYEHSPDASLKTIIDKMYSAAYSKYSTDPGYDGTYFSDIDDGGWWMPMSNGVAAYRDNGTHKYFGMSFGFGNVNSWPTQRIGGAQAAQAATVTVGYELASVPNAAKAEVVSTVPAGTETATECSASPCPVTVDLSVGNPLLQLVYRSTDGTVLAKGDAVPLRLR